MSILSCENCIKKCITKTRNRCICKECVKTFILEGFKKFYNEEFKKKAGIYFNGNSSRVVSKILNIKIHV